MIGDIFSHLGYAVIGDPEYSSRIKGGINSFNIFISDSDYTLSKSYDILMTFDAPNAQAYHSLLDSSGLIIANERLRAKIDTLPHVKQFVTHEDKFDNIYFLGLLGHILQIDQQIIDDEIESFFSEKPQIIESSEAIIHDMYQSEIDPAVRALFQNTQITRVGASRGFKHGNAFIADGAVL